MDDREPRVTVDPKTAPDSVEAGADVRSVAGTAGHEQWLPRPKVFGIGFHKTGTSSLAAAFAGLGYRVTGTFGVDDPDIAETALPKALEIAEHFDAFADNPWPILYRALEEWYPTARFVLTIRDTDDWLASIIAHFGGKSTPMREWIYGVGDPLDNQGVYRDRYEQHNRDVIAHFARRKDALLVMRVTAGEGWDPLCEFLGVEQPDEPFPHANAKELRKTARRIRNRAARTLFRRA